MSDHTPAPWHWIKDEWWGGHAALVDENDNTVLAPDTANDGDFGAAWFEEYPTKADRLLIQSSPELFETMEEIRDLAKTHEPAQGYDHSNWDHYRLNWITSMAQKALKKSGSETDAGGKK